MGDDDVRRKMKKNKAHLVVSQARVEAHVTQNVCELPHCV